MFLNWTRERRKCICVYIYIWTRKLLWVGLMSLPVLMLLKPILHHVCQLLPTPEQRGSLRNLLSPPVSARETFGRWIQFFTELISAYTSTGRAVMQEGMNEREMEMETAAKFWLPKADLVLSADSTWNLYSHLHKYTDTHPCSGWDGLA